MYCECALVSFLPAASNEAQFVKTVGNAIHTRLATTKLHATSFESLAEVVTCSFCKTLRIVLLAHSRSTYAHMREWLGACAHYEDVEEDLLQSHKIAPPLKQIGHIHTVPVYEFCLAPEVVVSQEIKQALWRQLQMIIQFKPTD